MFRPLKNAFAPAAIMDDKKDLPSIVLHNAHRLLKLINFVVDFSRIETGRSDARFLPTYLAALSGNRANKFDSARAQAGLELVGDCSPCPPRFRRLPDVENHRAQFRVERLRVSSPAPSLPSRCSTSTALKSVEQGRISAGTVACAVSDSPLL